MRIAVVLWACAPFLAAQTTWVVDHTGGGNFLDIPPAIAAASPGDRIVVQGTATYSSFVLDRGIDIEAVARAVVPTIEVVGVPVGERARVAGFDVARQGGVLSVSVRSCQGSVLLVDLIETGPSYQVQTGRPGLEILDSVRVFVDRGRFLGQPGTSNGGDGLRMSNSQAILLDASFTGGVNVSTYPNSGNDGKAGILLSNGSHAMLLGVTATGGPASQGNIAGGDGGNGLVALTGCHAVVVGACTLEGTPGGWGSFIWGSDGYSATGSVEHTVDCTLIGVSTGTTIPNRPVLSMTANVPVSTSLVVGVQGEAGSFVVLAVDFAHDYTVYPIVGGALSLTNAHFVVGIVLLDGAGVGSWSSLIPAGPWQEVDVFAQGVAPVAGEARLTAPAHSRLR